MINIWIPIAAVCGIAWLVMHLRAKAKASELAKRAKAHLASGDWKAAAGLYKEAIIVRIDAPSVVGSFADELDSIYRSNGVTGDTRRVRDFAKLHKEIWDSKTTLQEKARLAAKLVEEVTQYLKTLP